MMSSNQLTQLDRIFDEIFSNKGGFPAMTTTKSNYPPINISAIETDDWMGVSTYFIEVALAGFKREEIDVRMENVSQHGHSYNVVNIRAEKEPADTKVEYQRNGIAYRNVDKCIAVSNQDEITDATYVDGILRIDLQRVVKDSRGKSIKIN